MAQEEFISGTHGEAQDIWNANATDAETRLVDADSRLTNVEAGVTDADARLVVLETIAPMWRGHLELNVAVAAAVEFNLGQFETSGNISFDGTKAVTVNVGGVYAIGWTFFGVRSSGSDNLSMTVALKINGTTTGTANGTRFTTDQLVGIGVSGYLHTRLSQGDVITFSSGNTSLTPSNATNRQTVSIARVGN